MYSSACPGSSRMPHTGSRSSPASPAWATGSYGCCIPSRQLNLPRPPQAQHDERWHETRPADYLHFPLAEWARGHQLSEPVTPPRRRPQPVGEIVDPCLPAGLEDPVDLGQPAGRLRPVVQGECAHHPVELLVGERQRRDVTDLEAHPL